MDKKVLLTISGLHGQDGAENADVQTVTEAEYFQRNGSHYLLYEEKQEGFEQVSKNRIKFRKDSLELIRKGLLETRMVFEENKTHLTPYRTPYGEVMLGINTKKIYLQERENNITVKVEYQLEADGEYLSDSIIELHVKACK